MAAGARAHKTPLPLHPRVHATCIVQSSSSSCAHNMWDCTRPPSLATSTLQAQLLHTLKCVEILR
jgi:hypothetical protein